MMPSAQPSPMLSELSRQSSSSCRALSEGRTARLCSTAAKYQILATCCNHRPALSTNTPASRFAILPLREHRSRFAPYPGDRWDLMISTPPTRIKLTSRGPEAQTDVLVPPLGLGGDLLPACIVYAADYDFIVDRWVRWEVESIACSVMCRVWVVGGEKLGQLRVHIEHSNTLGRRQAGGTGWSSIPPSPCPISIPFSPHILASLLSTSMAASRIPLACEGILSIPTRHYSPSSEPPSPLPSLTTPACLPLCLDLPVLPRPACR